MFIDAKLESGDYVYINTDKIVFVSVINNKPMIQMSDGKKFSVDESIGDFMYRAEQQRVVTVRPTAILSPS